MGSKEKKEGGRGLSRRDFLKVSAAGAAGATALNWSIAEPAAAITQGMTEGTDYDTFHTTCPYCSASCGQIVCISKGTQGHVAGEVLDIWGDKESPINQGGLCAKGAGAYQLVTNVRRLGNPDNVQGKKADGTFNGRIQDSGGTNVAGFTGQAWKRTGNGPWKEMTLDGAFAELAPKLVAARGDVTPGLTLESNKKTVQFFGCSHMNNESNYLYRKLIADFGTSMTEHQARI